MRTRSLARPLSLMLALAGAALLGCAASVTAQQSANGRPIDRVDHDGADTPVLIVRGSAEVDAEADEIQIVLSVVTEGEDSQKAVAENSEKAQKVIDAVRRTGVASDSVRTRRFTLQPRYQPRPRHAEPDWTPRIIGYRVENEVVVKTGRLELAGAIIDKAVDAGANRVSSISFALSDPQKARSEAIRRATESARTDAEALAAAAGVRITGVRRIELDAPDRPGPIPYGRTMQMEAAAARQAPPIEPGEITVSARVMIEYRIGG